MRASRFNYIDSNISGFLNVLEGCRRAHTRHLVYASSSSVYGANTTLPFSVGQNVDHPLSLYGASKKANDQAVQRRRHAAGFTYVDDVAIAVVKLIDLAAQGNAAWSGDNPDPATSRAPWRIYNIDNHTPADLTEVVRLLEMALGKKAIRELMPMQPGDVRKTCADVQDLRKAVGFTPNTPIAVGIQKFVDWFRAFHGV